jgi:hypothetical protein
MCKNYDVSEYHPQLQSDNSQLLYHFVCFFGDHYFFLSLRLTIFAPLTN